MVKERIKKRGIAFCLACVMILTMFTGITSKACWWGDPEETPETAMQYGLWFGNCWYEGDENSPNYQQWVMDIGNGVELYSSEVSVDRMSDYRDLDLREVDGTWNNAYFFKYVNYEISEQEGEEPSIEIKDTQQITDNLHITYLGTELENDVENEGNTDPRWAKANVKDTTASIEAVSGTDGLCKMDIKEPGYYIISYGNLEIDENGYFINCNAAIGLNVYAYTGLAARDAYYDEPEGKWILNSDQEYGSDFGGRDLWESVYAVTNVIEGAESSISLDDMVITYYGEIGADPRWTYWDEEEEKDKYYVAQDTKATLEVYDQDSSLFRFIPDKPGEYLISKKGITDDVTDDNRAIREQAIRINVRSDRACFLKEAGNYSGQNLLTTVWDNCYRPSYISGQSALSFYYRAPLAYDEENGKEVDTFDHLVVWYSDVYNEVEVGKNEDGSIAIPDGLSGMFSMEPVRDNTGWYKITIQDLEGYLGVQFIDSSEQNAYLDVNYYEAGQTELRNISKGKTAYEFVYDDNMHFVTVPFTAEVYSANADAAEMTQVTEEDALSKFKVYMIEDIFWYDEENDTEELCEGFGFDSEKGEYTCEDPDISFYPNATEPWYALKNVDDLASVSVSGNKLVVQVNAIGDYILTDGGSGCYGFRVDLPNLGVYTSTDRKMNKYDVVENWPHSIQAYKGRTSEEMYVLGWIDPEHYDENGVAKEDIDPWATDPASIKIHAGENVQWTWEDGNPVKYTEIENFIRVDEDNPVKYANGAVYGYPITLTDAIDRDFSIIMSHERIGKDRTEECGSGIAETHYDQLDVTYISLKELKVKTAPTKVEYIEGATFDPSGLVVEAVYEDGKTFELTKEEYEISIGDKSVTDKLATTDKAVTISYLGKTVEQPITVNEKTKVDLSKAAWNYTEAFTADGTEKKVEITGLPTDVVNVEYKNNKASAVGTYTAEAVITLKDESAYQFASEIPASLKSLAWEIKAPQTTPEPTPTTPTTPEPTPTAPTTPETPAGTIKAGDTATVKGSSYKVTSVKNNKKTVTYTAGDKKATKITVPATVTINGTVYKVTAIADKAFSGCSKLTTVTISSNVISIGKNAFSGCKKLTKVTIGKNVKTIGANAFSGCSKLKTLSMGANVTTIGDKAFYKCTALTKVTIPAKVSKIGKQAFYGCKNLKSITIKTTKLNSKNVGSNAFKGIYAKAAIKVPKSKLTSYTEVLKAKGVSSKAEIKK